jgi:hypothetical protein
MESLSVVKHDEERKKEPSLIFLREFTSGPTFIAWRTMAGGQLRG